MSTPEIEGFRYSTQCAKQSKTKRYFSLDHLRARADDPDVIEAVAVAIIRAYCWGDEENMPQYLPSNWEPEARAALAALLESLEDTA